MKKTKIILSLGALTSPLLIASCNVKVTNEAEKSDKNNWSSDNVNQENTPINKLNNEEYAELTNLNKEVEIYLQTVENFNKNKEIVELNKKFIAGKDMQINHRYNKTFNEEYKITLAKAKESIKQEKIIDTYKEEWEL
ncbi:hypothetical protein [Mycoplasmopsis alligatoris]|uniref:Lipoprotein n=1 Tax=Mycoplasmopsis alligatoris A21JP2 TaxID=747682 RepID=D4XV56_9BACT|nr:hypothetical protein [Mycoplasmopsis alligatoris]EFF41755.1 hypothetical protein MALL_0784 [Mycoplasmopsis alligatoris A21JP2]